MKLVAILAFSTLFTVAAGADELVTEQRDVEGYHGIAFAIPGELRVEQSGNESLRVVAGEDVIGRIITEVEDGVLIIRRDRSLWSSRMGKVEVFVEIDDFESLAVSGSGDAVVGAVKADDFQLKVSGSGSVSLQSLTCDEVDVAISGSAAVAVEELRATEASTSIGGSGEVTWSGVVDAQAIRISGSGDYRGADLQSNAADVVVSGSGDIDVRVEDELDAVVSGSGTVRYYGDPEVSQVVSGSGSVSKG